MDQTAFWPSLPLDSWKDTYDTLHMWTQIVGMIRMKRTPLINHWWNVTFYITSRGLTTSPIPYGNRAFEIEFDFIDHELKIHTSEGARVKMALVPRSVADFHRELMALLATLDIHVTINPAPAEIPNPIPFEEDRQHASYDPESVRRLHQILLQSQRVFGRFRGRFIGKCSPIHFFWGSLDLAVTRFSGRRAPERPGADSITREAYSHEVSSCGFWPGSGNVQGPAYYAYAAPEPAGYRTASILPKQAFYNPPTQGYVLMYDDVRQSPDPAQAVLDFVQSTYEAAADLGHWDRAELERPPRKLKAAA
jgi:hypothetical protein